jgi:hypothetical protein
VVRRIFGPQRDEISGIWRKMLHEGLDKLHPLPKIIRVTKPRKMRQDRACSVDGSGVRTGV